MAHKLRLLCQSWNVEKKALHSDVVLWAEAAVTYTATVCFSLRSGFVALFGRRETELENGCLTPKTILNREHKLSNPSAQNMKSRAQIIIQKQFFSPRNDTSWAPYKTVLFFQVSIVYWWLNITSSVIRLWFLQCYRLTLSDWWKKQFHHTFHGLLVGDNNFFLRYMQCHNLSACLAALKIWPSPELQHKSLLSAQSKDLIQVYPLTGCCLTV